MWKVLKKNIRRIVLLGIISLVLFITHEIRQNFLFGCPDDEARKILQHLCLLYKNNRVAGNLCSDLCNTGALQYVSCFNYKRGKAVFSSTWNGKRVILKSKFGHLSNYSRPFATVVNKKGGSRTVTPDVALFATMVYHHIQGEFGFDLKLSTQDILARMWHNGDSSRTSNDQVHLSEAEMVSLWALLQQEEYVFFQFWNGFQHYPKVYGSCGHFYAVENVPSGFILNPNAISMQEQLASLPWANRARIALSLLELVSALDSEFPEKLHLCDVKHDNFGVRKDLIVKAIDVDIAFFQNQLDTTLNQPQCAKEEDCHFFDCKGSCNMDTGKCNSERANTNLQAICQDVFSRHYSTPGLLRLPPTQVAWQLDAALQDCLNQKGLPVDVKVSQTSEFQRLRELLEESLNYVEKERLPQVQES